MFEELVGLIDKIKDDSIGEWIVDKENDGTLEHPMQMPFVVYSSVVRLFEQAVYGFEEDHPEFELNRYGSILERYSRYEDGCKKSGKISEEGYPGKCSKENRCLLEELVS